MGISFHCQQPEDKRFEVSFYFPFRHHHSRTLFAVHNDNLPYEWLRDLRCVIERTDCKFVGHGFKFDFKVLEREGFNLTGTLYDTLLLSWMHNENKFSHELSELAKLVGDHKERTELKEIAKNLEGGWTAIPPELMERYACGDTRITFKLYEYFWPKLVEQELDVLYEREEKKLRILTKMEQRGIKIDKDTALKLSEEARTRMQETLAQFGYDPGKPSQLAHRLFGAEPQGLALPALGGWSKRKSSEFPRGLPNMGEAVLSRLNHPEALRVLDYRSWQKANSTWYEGWFNKTTNDSRIHPEFKQHGTVTTRLSCTKPNMQQIPRDVDKTPVKRMLRAGEGYELWEFDYSQMEFRLGAIYAECLPILEAYKTGLDVHQLTSDRLRLEELTGLSRAEARYAAKQTNFLTIYGGGPDVLRYQIWRDARMELPIETAENILDQFHKSYPEFRKIMKKCESVARQRHYIKMWTGRRRHFDVVWKYKDAYNSIIQGGCAEIIFDSMIELHEQGFELVSQVHDSLWIEIPIESSEADRERVRKIMEWPSERFEIPFPIDSKRLA